MSNTPKKLVTNIKSHFGDVSRAGGVQISDPQNLLILLIMTGSNILLFLQYLIKDINPKALKEALSEFIRAYLRINKRCTKQILTGRTI